MATGPAQDPRPEEDREAGQQQRAAEQQAEQHRTSRARHSEMGHEEQGDDRRRDAARGEAADDLPVDRLAPVVNDCADGLGDRRIEQVGADRGRGMEAEQQHEERSHQRAAADPGQADQYPDQQPGQRIKRIVSGKDRCPPFIRSKDRIPLARLAQRFAQPNATWARGTNRAISLKASGICAPRT